MSPFSNLYELFRERFPEKPDAPFIETPDGAVLRYGELDGLCARGQGVLRDAGVGPGDRVVVQVEKSPEAVVLYLACLRAGAVYVPLNTAYTVAEVEYFLADAEPALVVVAPDALVEARSIAERLGIREVLTLGTCGDGSLAERAAVARAAPRVEPRAGDDVAAILYTSGTTGRSKGAMLTHRNLASNALVLHEIWRWRPDDVLLHALPIYHAHGLFVALHCPLLNGTGCLFLPRFDVEQVIRLLPRATVVMGVPTFYTRLLDRDSFTADVCSGTRVFISGSAPLLAETHVRFEERTGHRILERYGMTEAGMITSNPYDGERIAGTVGYPLPGVEARVVGKDGREAPRGEPGVLEIRGPNVFAGYWRNPEKTAEELRPDGFFVTGDVATMEADGRVTLVGRARDLIISGGFNVYPREIEIAIDEVPGVRESAVVGVPHPDFGEGVTAIVVPDEGAEIDECSLRAHLEPRLARFKQPKSFFLIDELPRNAMGKVQKNRLRETYRDVYANEPRPRGS